MSPQPASCPPAATHPTSPTPSRSTRPARHSSSAPRRQRAPTCPRPPIRSFRGSEAQENGQREGTGQGEAVEIRARLVQSPAQLAEEEVHVPERTFYEDRLVELSDSLGENIHVVEVDSVSHETLIREVASGAIQFTVSPENVAELRESYFTNVTIQPTVSPTHNVTLALRNNAPELEEALNAFIRQARESGRLDALYQKYFLDRQGIEERVASEYLTSETGRLSEYDDLLKRHAPAIGWDWRLLASQAYQESRFQPRARSWAGAMGILQLMPATAREVNVTDPNDPEDNIAGAVRYLQWLTGQWEDEIADPEQRLRFILASYNAGFGHVSDARRLAETNGDNPDRWDDVAYWLLQKSKRSVYSLPVVRYGYCRGLEPVTYVARILERYAHYQEFVEA